MELHRDPVMEQMDCYHRDEPPDVECPYPDLPRTDCYPDEECLELVMEVLGLAETESVPLMERQLLLVLQLLQPASSLTSQLA